ncbi:MAG: tetratricopeptide repeat protein [Acidobacteriota bacterium]|jgi:tetratricopeptide (TPR) repeat protein
MRVSRLTLLVTSIVMWVTLSPLTFGQSSNSPGEGESENDAPINDSPKIYKPAPKKEPQYTKPPETPIVTTPIIIQGTVIREDGSPPPFGTVIERDCGYIVVQEVLVNSNGSFSFIIGDQDRASGLFADASQNFFSNRAEMDEDEYEYNPSRIRGKILRENYPEHLLGCVLLANYAGYYSTYAKLGVVQKTGLIQVGTIILYPMSKRTGKVVSVTNLKASKPAREALEKGKKAFKQDEYDAAENYFQSALSIYPQYADAWIELGWLYQKQKNYEAARKAYIKASDTDKLFVNPYIRLAQLSAIEQKWEDAMKYSDKALSLDPVAFPEALFLKALAHYNLDQLDLAEQIIRRGIKIDLKNQIPKMYLLLANICAKKQDHSESIEAMRQYLAIKPDAPDADNVRTLIKEYKKVADAEVRKEAADR